MTDISTYLAELIISQFEKRKPSNIPENVKLEDLEIIALKHHIGVLIFGALLNLDLPEDKRKAYISYVANRIYTSATQMIEAKKLTEIYEEHEVINQLLKGSLLKNDYPVPEMREMSDIDVLIYEKDLERVNDILLQNDYMFVRKEIHHDIYRKPPYTVLELHYALYDKHVDKEQYEYFKSFEKAHVCEGYKYSMEFSQEDFYVYMMAHMAKHFYARGCGIRNLIDIYIYRKQHSNQMNQSYIDNELKKTGLYVFTKKMEHLSDVWLGGNYKQETPLDSDLFMYMLDCGIYGKDDYGFWNKYAKEADKNNKQSSKHLKTSLKRWYYFPPMYYMVDYYPWLNNKPFLLPWAWMVRGVTGIFGKKGMERRRLLKSVAPVEIRKIQNIYHEMELEFKA